MVDKKDPAKLSDNEHAEQQHDAAKDIAKEAAKAKIAASTGTETDEEPQTNRWPNSDEIMQFAYMVDMPLDQLKETLDAKSDRSFPEDKIAGLYKLERNGQNRTEYVRYYRQRLGLKKGEDVPGAGGPSYTNDTTNLTEL